MDVTVSNNIKKRRSKIHPFKYALWVACAAIVMMFAAMTSAYLVRKAGGNWLEFTLPDIFYFSTVAMLLSSVALHGSFLAYKKENASQHRLLLSIAALLGITFVILQYQGWQDLIAQGIELKTNPSSSFLYVISGLHVAHVIPGIVALLITFVITFFRKQESTPLGKLRLELVLHYWHFVDFLWVYLFIFLLIQ